MSTSDASDAFMRPSPLTSAAFAREPVKVPLPVESLEYSARISEASFESMNPSPLVSPRIYSASAAETALVPVVKQDAAIANATMAAVIFFLFMSNPLIKYFVDKKRTGKIILLKYEKSNRFSVMYKFFW